jgi:hypothetical protein
MLSFSYTILLMGMTTRYSMGNANMLRKRSLASHTLPPVCLHGNNLLIKLSLYKGLEVSENNKDI